MREAVLGDKAADWSSCMGFFSRKRSRSRFREVLSRPARLIDCSVLMPIINLRLFFSFPLLFQRYLHSLVSMISPCDATSSSVLGLYFSTQGADAAVAAARARASADKALAVTGALPLASAFAAAAAEASAAAAAASAVDAGASTMSASVILERQGKDEGERATKERESVPLLFLEVKNLVLTYGRSSSLSILFPLFLLVFFRNLASIGCASSSPAQAERGGSRDSSSRCRAGDAAR